MLLADRWLEVEVFESLAWSREDLAFIFIIIAWMNIMEHYALVIHQEGHTHAHVLTFTLTLRKYIKIAQLEDNQEHK